LEESEFLAQSGCPPGELENWLAAGWNQHNIRAIIAGSEVVGPQPHLLVRHQDNQATVRLFCPTRKLLRQNARRDASASLREYIAGRPWVESCDEIVSQIVAITAACAARQLPTGEIKLLWFALWIAIEELLQSRDGLYTEHMKRLHASVVTFCQAFQERGNPSPQSKYSEARVSARRSLNVKHNPVMDSYPALVEVVREVCSHELATYMEDDIHLDADHFLDMLHTLAHDGADPATVANPPARIRVALRREDRRRERLFRLRWQQPTPEQSAAAPAREQVESVAITNADWEIGRRRLALPPDQTQAIEEQLDGSDMPSNSGSNAADRKSVRRSLAADRPWGRKLRKQFAYLQEKPGP
jgi:hypothetical protein